MTTETLGYQVSVDEMIFQDPIALHRLQERMADQLLDSAADALYKWDYEDQPMSWSTSKPVRSYDEDGVYTGTHILYMVEMPVWR